MTLALIVYGTLALAAALALIALVPPLERHAHVMPTMRTTALLIAAAVYIAAIWSHT